MAVGKRSSDSSNFPAQEGLPATPTIADVAAEIGDWIYSAIGWRGTGGGGGTEVTIAGPNSWNGQTLEQVGATVPMIAEDEGTFQLALFRVKAAAAATAPIIFTLSDSARAVAGYAVKTGVDGDTPNGAPVTQQVFDPYSIPSLNVTGLVSGDEVLEILLDGGWDSGYDDDHTTVWSPSNSQTNVFDQAPYVDAAGQPQLRMDSKAGTGTVTVGYTASPGTPGYIHLALRLIAAVTDTAAPSFTDGPDITAVADTTATIEAEADESGTAAFIPDTPASSQPADAAFDAVDDAITTDTPFSKNLTSLAAATLYKVWNQLKDAVPNRRTSSSMLLTSHTGASSRVTLASINADPDLRITAVPDLEVGMILEITEIDGAGEVTLFDDGTFYAEPGAVDRFFVVGGNLTDGWGVGGWQTLTSEPEPEVPNGGAGFIEPIQFAGFFQ